MYSTRLKINRLSLAAEARIISRECARLKRLRKFPELNDLRLHRIGPLRAASRTANLAHTFLMDKPYAIAERAKGNQLPLHLCKEIATKVSKFGPAATEKQVSDWMEGKVTPAVET